MAIHIQPRGIEVPEDDPFKNDLLGHREAVDTLTHLVGNVEGPCVLAIDAPWGAGKTTFLRIWAQHLRNHGFPVVKFNAWETDFSEEPFLTLSTELTEGLQSEETKLPNKTIKNLKDASLEVLRWVVPGAIRAAASFVPVAGPEIGQAAASFAEKRLSQYQEARKSVAEFRGVLREMATALSEANGDRPLMVVIDELDRCRPPYAVELLEVAKHLFSVDRVVFVLAVNRAELAHSVRALYGSEFEAEGYLRRFFDVDLRLPEANRQAFIHVQLQTTGIYDYFDRTQDPEALSENPHAMLLSFFGTSVLSLRTIAQAIHRLGLLFASLRSDQRAHALATTVALILRTINPDLYHRFNLGEATDLDVVNAVFGRPALKALQHEESGTVFEAAIVLAALEDEIPNMSPSEMIESTLFSLGSIRTPLLDWYLDRQQTDREIKAKGGDPEIEERLSEGKHAERVFTTVQQAIRHGQGQIGFSQAVRRLELLSATLIDRQPDPSPTNS